MILPLDSKRATLEATGGKGMNLARLARAEFPVPSGFLVTTEGYREFVITNGLEAVIRDTISILDPSYPTQLEAASSKIREAFTQGTIPVDLADALRTAYAELDGPDCAVAVRSSATAEDLPDLSFAGQQDTFLHIVGVDAVLQAVIDCWSSLWTARAIGYRARNGIGQNDIALAVIVQLMVPSEVSGVLFTANPLNGKRTEMVIDATWGLGEALVSGQVEPDQYVVEAADSHILNKTIGSKSVRILGQTGGGTITKSSGASDLQALPDNAIVKLADLGRDIHELFASPQDMEWAWVENKLWLLQTRPITSLYPLLEGVDPTTVPVKGMFSFGVVQGMLDPMTPLGRDVIRVLFVGASRLFGYDLTPETQRILYTAGERLFVDLSPIIRHPIGRRIVTRFMRFIDPGATSVIGQLIEDPRFQPAKHWFKFSTLRRAGKFMVRIPARYLRTMRHPDRERRKFQEEMETLISDFSQCMKEVDSFSARIDLCEKTIGEMFPYLIPRFVPLIGVGMGSLTLLNRLAAEESWDSALAVTRGLPYNVTTEMDLALWETAAAINEDPDSRNVFNLDDGQTLAQLYLDEELPTVAQTAVGNFMSRYGMRGIGEIDMGRQRWREDPEQIMQVLSSYLQIEDPTMAPDAVFRRSQQEAEESIAALVQGARHGLFGRLRAKITRAAARRVRALNGLRETPKFTIIQIFGIVRESLLDSGQQLVDTGVLRQPDDLFYLRFSEMKQLAVGEQGNWCSLISARREAGKRESQRRQIPIFILSDGQVFHEGITEGAQSGDDSLLGSPVSPGVVEGSVRVVLNPKGIQLQPGEILVCQGTDPAWTPLFLSAGGLVMEVGGLMTHGSVVAREYGIPAVVGVAQATTRLQDGQQIRVDGSSGKIFLMS